MWSVRHGSGVKSGSDILGDRSRYGSEVPLNEERRSNVMGKGGTGYTFRRRMGWERRIRIDILGWETNTGLRLFVELKGTDPDHGDQKYCHGLLSRIRSFSILTFTVKKDVDESKNFPTLWVPFEGGTSQNKKKKSVRGSPRVQCTSRSLTTNHQT